jgi:hypothetical protein
VRAKENLTFDPRSSRLKTKQHLRGHRELFGITIIASSSLRRSVFRYVHPSNNSPPKEERTMADNNNEDNRNLRSHGGGGGPEITLSTPILITEQKGGEEHNDNNSTGFAIDDDDNVDVDITAIQTKVRQLLHTTMKERCQSGRPDIGLMIFFLWLWYEMRVWWNPRANSSYLARKKAYYNKKDTEKGTMMGSDDSN